MTTQRTRPHYTTERLAAYLTATALASMLSGDTEPEPMEDVFEQVLAQVDDLCEDGLLEFVIDSYETKEA